MAYTGEQLEANAQLERARESLGEALGQTQDIGHSGLDVDKVSESIAKSVRLIFAAQSDGLMGEKSGDNIKQSMDYLRETLMLLQDVKSDDPGLARITSTVAHIMALLYPVSKVLESLGEPIPLTEKADEPIPLTEKADEPIPLTEESGHERRSFIRRSIEVDIGIHSDTNFFTGFSQDISSGGIFFATYDILSLGTEVNVNFRLPNGPVLSLNGIVRWVREYNEIAQDIEPGMGIEFNNLSPDDRQAINLFISQHPPIFYDGE
ncbi:MAG: TIGR02266 family protein [Deltaproteobacteria bacterium]|nr:TIGR02266 family protein [Deltaproteobacteria bacterium]